MISCAIVLCKLTSNRNIENPFSSPRYPKYFEAGGMKYFPKRKVCC
jgi:hypothetical protein